MPGRASSAALPSGTAGCCEFTSPLHITERARTSQIIWIELLLYASIRFTHAALEEPSR